MTRVADKSLLQKKLLKRAFHALGNNRIASHTRTTRTFEYGSTSSIHPQGNAVCVATAVHLQLLRQTVIYTPIGR